MPVLTRFQMDNSEVTVMVYLFGGFYSVSFVVLCLLKCASIVPDFFGFNV